MSSEFLRFGVRCAIKAGKELMRYYGSASAREKARLDIVTEADLSSEKVIIESIRSRYPEHGILAEESGDNNKESDYRWVIDPLDGTVNFFHSYPLFSVSIALEYCKEPNMGVIYNPYTRELYTAEKDKGAFLNNKRIGVSDNSSLKDALLFTGFTHEDKTLHEKSVRLFSNLLRKTQGIRRGGSAALEMADVAAGRADGYWELNIHRWDVSAGILLVREAGGRVLWFEGKINRKDTTYLVAANQKIYPVIISEIRKEFPEIRDNS